MESPDTPVPGVTSEAVRVHCAPQTWVGGPVNVRERSRWLPRRPGRSRPSAPPRPKER